MDDIENWYERIVFKKIRDLASEEAGGEDRFDASLWSDVACLTLNHLPPRYVRHSVDMHCIATLVYRADETNRLIENQPVC